MDTMRIKWRRGLVTLYRNPPAVPVIGLFLSAILLRVVTYGDPNMGIDEDFYVLVGLEMHKGAVPYVAIWDRKPFGLFALYYLWAAFPDPVLAYQLGATAAAFATSLIIYQTAARRCGPVPSFIASLCYLTTMNALAGQGGQGPVFYNLLVSWAALAVLRFLEDGNKRRLCAAMFALGCAITFKQTAFFEAVFFGLFALAGHRSLRLTILSVMCGATPFILIGVGYYAAGHWPEFWYAMVTANLDRPGLPPDVIASNALQLLVRVVPLLLLAVKAFLFDREAMEYRFLGMWLIAAAIGFLSVPFFIEHYALPMLVPLSIVVSAVASSSRNGLLLSLFVCAYGALLGRSFDLNAHRDSKAEFDQATSYIRSKMSPDDRLFIYEGPPLLYPATGKRPITVLSFPGHLSNEMELNTSHIPTLAELRRIIATRPEAVVIKDPSMRPPDVGEFRKLLNYLRSSCAAPRKFSSREGLGREETIVIFAKCGKEATASEVQ